MQLSLPKILKKIRLDRELSQENIAEELKIDSTTYGRYEKGESQIKFEQVAQLAEFYKLTLDELYHYGNPAYSVVNEPAGYSSPAKVLVTVELDGVENNLKAIIERLKAINRVLSKTPT